MEAFLLGLDRGADAIECDVHLSSDGELMVIHDPTVDRTTNGKGRVAEMTRAEIGALDAGSWKAAKWCDARVPTLPEVLDLVPTDRRILIEVKVGTPGLPRLKEILAATALPPDRIIVMEFDLETVLAMRAAFPDLEVLWLLDFPRLHLPSQKRRTLKKNINYAASHGFDGVNIQNIAQLDADIIAECRAQNLKSYCWTVDNPARTAELFNHGINGVATNRPGWIREQLDPSEA